jgi:hypothetical protein
MTPNHKQFETALKATAEEALKILPEKERVQFALKVMLDATDAGVASTLEFAANRITEHANILIREAYEREHE